MIAVCIATYNHESFIAQAIESVQAQVCVEPLRIYIGDDASTDGTQEVCERYAAKDERIVYVRRSQNLGLVSNTVDLYRRIMADGCEYTAMLDGDDYWTDPHKLQKQADYMRLHPETGFVHTSAKVFSGAQTWTFGQREGVYGLDSVGFANCTVMFRTALMNEELLQAIEAQHFRWLDYPLYGVFYQQTQWAYLPDETAVWRDHTSVSQPKTAREILQLREERVRMWKWLDGLFPGKVGYSSAAAETFLFEQRMNLIYQFDDRTLVTEALLERYQPRSWKQRLKQKGLKNDIIYTILQKISFYICINDKKVVSL